MRIDASLAATAGDVAGMGDATCSPAMNLPSAFAAAIMASVLGLAASDASAQCGAKPSTCSTCHDGERAPIPGSGPWHDDHAFASLCAECHGGRGDAADVVTAHVGLVAPLTPGSACITCHGAAAAARVARYRNIRTEPNDAGANAMAPARDGARGERWPNVLLLCLVGALGTTGAFLVARNERRRQQP